MGQTFISVDIKVKPHVKFYLENNYGNPVRLERGSFISKYLVALLSRPYKRDNDRHACYPEQVNVIINEDHFRRFGFGLTRTAVKDFNLAIEHHIKSLIRGIADNILLSSEINENWEERYRQLKKEHSALLKVHHSELNSKKIKELKKFEVLLNQRLADSEKHKVKVIDALQMAAYVCLGFDEQILPLETIRKDYYRYKLRQKP